MVDKSKATSEEKGKGLSARGDREKDLGSMNGEWCTCRPCPIAHSLFFLL